ncbi:MAG: hypothetical protein DLM55_12010 [Acidimicrobiales bacterium]|nr:MAG: hypothetical protein DLM55_12010 [Acidimicrobiales bacterium]
MNRYCSSKIGWRPLTEARALPQQAKAAAPPLACQQAMLQGIRWEPQRLEQDKGRGMAGVGALVLKQFLLLCEAVIT